MEIVLKILLLLGLVVINGFFVAAEFALVKIRDTLSPTSIRFSVRRNWESPWRASV
jgi:CBS domain containing-hemolysin-like protein